MISSSSGKRSPRSLRSATSLLMASEDAALSTPDCSATSAKVWPRVTNSRTASLTTCMQSRSGRHCSNVFARSPMPWVHDANRHKQQMHRARQTWNRCGVHSANEPRMPRPRQLPARMRCRGPTASSPLYVMVARATPDCLRNWTCQGHGHHIK